jgi:molecular chaperone DnaK
VAIIGIDLGTSNSAAAVLRDGQPVIIPSSEGVSPGGKAFPSYVGLTPEGEILIGEPARRQAVSNPLGTATAFKRRMGQRQKVKLLDREFSPEQLAAFLLQKIKRDAEAFLGEPVDRAVVTVPAYFDDNQRSATKDACNIAGIKVERLVNEPTAAALAYGLDRVAEELRIAVIDLGGGTLDVTIMEFGKGVFEVKATSGDTRLGGTDMDRLVVEHLADRFFADSGIDVRKEPKALARLLEAAEDAKIELSSSTTTHISLPYLGSIGGELKNLELELTRAQLEHLVREVIERCRGPVKQALRDAGLRPVDIDRIIFVGGPTRMPAVRAFFESLFGKTAEHGINPMECVACGAAIQAGVLDGRIANLVLVDVTPLTLGVETQGGVATPLIPRNTPIPVKHSERFTTTTDLQSSVTVRVYQGERPMYSDNISLGEFILDGILPAPRGLPQIEVTFDIDADGILNVSARDVATGRSQSIRITGSTRLSQEDKGRMIKAAQRYAEEDQARRQAAEQLNEADAACYQAEKVLTDFARMITDDLRQRLQTGLYAVREAVNAGDGALAAKQTKELKRHLKEAEVVIYSQMPGSGIYSQVRKPGMDEGEPV